MDNYISVKKAAEKWGISERMVRRYCTQGRIENAQQRRLRAKPLTVRKACSDCVVQAITFSGIPSSRRRSRNSSPAISGSYRSSSRCS